MLRLLQLTPHERQWNDYYTTRGADGRYRLGVLGRRYTQTVTINAATPAASVIHFTARRSRVWSITWSGDVYALRVQPRTSTGELFCDQPIHIPLLSGHAPISTLTQSALIPPYPLALAPGDLAVHQEPRWWWLIEPNIVLPGDKQLICDYQLENPNDPALAQGASYVVTQVIHSWEFPGFEGGPV